MGFMSELVTLIWLIVEQSAVEQPVQTRFQMAGVPGMGRALPGEQPRPQGPGRTGEPGGWAERAFARDALAYRPLAPCERSRPCLAARICNPWFDPKSAVPASGVRGLSCTSGLER